MKRFSILMMLIFISIFELSFANYGETRAYIKKIYIGENPIKNQSTRIPFEAEIILEDISKYNTEDCIYIAPSDQRNEGLVISQQGININWSNTQKKTNNILTFKDINSAKKIRGKVHFTLKGKMVITDWNKLLMTDKKTIFLGYIRNLKDSSYESLWLEIDIKLLEIISSIKIDVLQHMHLGNAISGEALSTQNFKGGYPAKIQVMALPCSKIKVSIPKSIRIHSNRHQASDLEVNLYYVNGKGNLKNNNIEQCFYTGYCGNSPIISIGGETAITTKNHYGKYKGEFTVRVEYQ